MSIEWKSDGRRRYHIWDGEDSRIRVWCWNCTGTEDDQINGIRGCKSLDAMLRVLNGHRHPYVVFDTKTGKIVAQEGDAFRLIGAAVAHYNSHEQPAT